MQRRNALLPSLLIGALLAGCGGPGEPGSPAGSAEVRGSVTVFAAASLAESFSTLGKQFQLEHAGTTVRFSFAASSALATQIRDGAPADVFASASPSTMSQVVDAGKATGPTTFATNSMQVAVPADNPAHVDSLDDLAGDAVTTALCQPQVPCGATAQQVLDNAGITVTPVTLEPDVKAVLSKVVLGEVDAGLVYVTDVLAARPAVSGVEIPDAVNTRTSYPIATLTASANPLTAQAFVDFVMSPAGVSVLSAAGFGLAESDPA